MEIQGALVGQQENLLILMGTKKIFFAYSGKLENEL